MSSAKSSGPAIVILGDITVDILARLDAFPRLGGDCLVSELEFHCGGVGANTALALAKWGVPVRLLGCTGGDWFGDLALGVLRREGVDVTFLQQAESALTGLMFVAISPDGQRTMFGSRGANALLPVSAGMESCLEGRPTVHLVGYNFLSDSVSEAAGQLLREARQRRGWVSLDVGMAPSHRIPHTILQVARKADIVFLNGEEAVALTGQRDSVKAFEALEQQGLREVVVKLGEQGCLFRDKDQLRQAPAFSVPAADTTGAGDAFTAAFLRGRLHRWGKAETAVLANAAGAAAAAVVGAGERMPALRQIVGLLAGSRLAAPWELVRTQVLERLRAELTLPDESGAVRG